MKYAIALMTALTLNATANLMMKFGVKRLKADLAALAPDSGMPWMTILTNWVLIVGLFCFAVNVAFYTYALSGIKISVAYPIMVTGGFVIIAIVAWKYLDESMSPTQWVGVALVLLGVTLVAREMSSVSASG